MITFEDVEIAMDQPMSWWIPKLNGEKFKSDKPVCSNRKPPLFAQPPLVLQFNSNLFNKQQFVKLPML